VEIMKILHYGKSGDVKYVARTSKQISRVCVCLSLNSTLVYISLVIIFHSYMLVIVHVLTLALIHKSY